MSQVQKQEVKKPIPLRIVFILNALKIILAFTLFFINKDEPKINIDPMWILYTGIGYVVTFVTMVFSILKKKIWLYRTVFIIDVIISLPAKAYIGIAIGLFSFGMSFSKKIRHFFGV